MCIRDRRRIARSRASTSTAPSVACVDDTITTGQPGDARAPGWDERRRAVLRDALAVGAATGAYGLRLSALLRVRGPGRLLAAHLVIDESCAMAVARTDRRSARLAFWATGWSVFALWNLATLLGALGAQTLRDPRVFGLDAAAPAAFLALLAPRLRGREAGAVAAAAGVLGLAITPAVPAGVPILAVAAGTVLVGLLGSSRRRSPS